MDSNFNTPEYQIPTPTYDVQVQVLRNTYLLLALSLIPTVIGVLFGINTSFGLLAASPILGSLAIIGGLYFLMFMVHIYRTSYIGIIWMMLFTFIMGFFLGPLFQVTLSVHNGGQLIILAALLTAGIFFIMSAIGFLIKHELPFLTKFLIIGSWVLLSAIVANIFLQLPIMHLVICGSFVIFSSLVIVWQINRIVLGGETNYISAALTLYLQLYNLFTSILQIILSGRNRQE